MDQLMGTDNEAPLTQHKIVSPEEWIAARRRCSCARRCTRALATNSAGSGARFRGSRSTRIMSSIRPKAGRRSGDLFEGRSQLIVYHFMFGPGWDEGCIGCSFLADHMDGANLHLSHHDV